MRKVTESRTRIYSWTEQEQSHILPHGEQVIKLRQTPYGSTTMGVRQVLHETIGWSYCYKQSHTWYEALSGHDSQHDKHFVLCDVPQFCKCTFMLGETATDKYEVQPRRPKIHGLNARARKGFVNMLPANVLIWQWTDNNLRGRALRAQKTALAQHAMGHNIPDSPLIGSSPMGWSPIRDRALVPARVHDSNRL